MKCVLTATKVQPSDHALPQAAVKGWPEDVWTAHIPSLT